MRERRLRPSPALVVAIVALVVAMVGTGYAATKLPKNSVGIKQIKKNAVNGAKVKDRSLTGKDINLAKLGTVPAATTATHAVSADTATSATSAGTANAANGFTSTDPLHRIGAPGEPPFENGAGNVPAEGLLNYEPASFSKDHDGWVHLEGAVKSGPTLGLVFRLPPGYRPAAGKILFFEYNEDEIVVIGDGVSTEGKDLSGMVAIENNSGVSLSGISFKAQG